MGNFISGAVAIFVFMIGIKAGGVLGGMLFGAIAGAMSWIAFSWKPRKTPPNHKSDSPLSAGSVNTSTPLGSVISYGELSTNSNALAEAVKLEKQSNWEQLLKFSEDWISNEPKNLFAWQAKGDALRKLRRLPEAANALLEGLKLCSRSAEDNPGSIPLASSLWYRLGHVYGELGQVDIAINALKEAAALNPNAVDILNDLGVFYVNQHDYENAFEVLKKAATADPSNANSLKNLGMLYAICGLEAGVNHIHGRLMQIDVSTATIFFTQARELLNKEKDSREGV